MKTKNQPDLSSGHLLQTLIAIRFESVYPIRDITVFHKRFNNEPDATFVKFAAIACPDEIAPDAKTIAKLTEYIRKYMQNDPLSTELYIEYDKQSLYSWVYCKPLKEIRSAGIGEHEKIIIDMCTRYFKGVRTIDRNYLKRFILQNFEIQSDYSSLNIICKDINYIADTIETNNIFS